MLQKLKQLFSKVKNFILGIFNESDANYIADEHFIAHQRHIQAHIDAIQRKYISVDSELYQSIAADKAPKKKKKSKKKAKKKTKRSSK